MHNQKHFIYKSFTAISLQKPLAIKIGKALALFYFLPKGTWFATANTGRPLLQTLQLMVYSFKQALLFTVLKVFVICIPLKTSEKIRFLCYPKKCNTGHLILPQKTRQYHGFYNQDNQSNQFKIPVQNKLV